MELAGLACHSRLQILQELGKEFFKARQETASELANLLSRRRSLQCRLKAEARASKRTRKGGADPRGLERATDETFASWVWTRDGLVQLGNGTRCELRLPYSSRLA